jgi:general secretion pathway protein M
MSSNNLMNWYIALSPRDQRVLQLGSFALLIILLVGIFLPLHRKLGEADAQLKKQQEDFAWMQQVDDTLAAAGPGPTAVATKDSLVVLIDRSARESGLAQSLAGTQPSAGGSMRVQLERADFNMLTGWLSRLSSQHGVKVDSATITGSTSPGIVNATVQLRAR